MYRAFKPYIQEGNKDNSWSIYVVKKQIHNDSDSCIYADHCTKCKPGLHSTALSITNTSTTTRATNSDDSGISSSQRASQSQSNRNNELSDSNKSNLTQLINASAFFQAKNVYPPDASGPQDYTLNILSITMDNVSRTVLWSDTSSNVPVGISRIAQTLQEIASK